MTKKYEKPIKLHSHWIKLKCGIEVLIDWNSQTQCKGCGQEIMWAVTRKKKLIPVRLVGLAEWDTHFIDCPMADKFRKRGEFLKSKIKN